MIFIPNFNLAEDLMADSEFRDGIAGTAGEEVKAAAEDLTVRIMPRGPQAFQVESDEDGVRVVNLDYGGAIAEWGAPARNFAPRAPLRRAAVSRGLRLSEAPKSSS